MRTNIGHISFASVGAGVEWSNCEADFKDRELQDGMTASVHPSAGRHHAAQHSEAGSSIYARPFEKKHSKHCMMIQKKREKQRSSEGLTNFVYKIKNITFNTPTFGFVCHGEYKKTRARSTLGIRQRRCGQSSWRRRCWWRLLRP